MKPATQARQLSYVNHNLLAASPGGNNLPPARPECVSSGRSFYFISHAWQRPFPELVEMLRQHFSEEQQRVWRPAGQAPLPPSQVFVWLDILAMNQHSGSDIEFSALLVTLKEMVWDSSQTLMVLDPKASILTRILCLHEAWQSGQKGAGSLALLSYGMDFADMQQVGYF